MFKKKAVETMYNGSKDDGFFLEQWAPYSAVQTEGDVDLNKVEI